VPRSPGRAWLAEIPGPVSGPSPTHPDFSRVGAFPPVGSFPSPPSSVLHPDPPPRLSSAGGFGHPLPLTPSGDLTEGPDGASQVPTRSLCARNGLRPRQSGGASHNGTAHVAFTTTDRLGLCNFSNFVAHSHSSHNCCVRFSPAVTGRTCNTRYRAARYALPGRDFHPLDRASFSWRTRCYRNPDPHAAFARRHPAAACLLGHEMVDPDQSRRSEIWVDFGSRHQPAFHFIGVIAPLERGCGGRLAWHRPQDTPAFSEANAS